MTEAVQAAGPLPEIIPDRLFLSPHRRRKVWRADILTKDNQPAGHVASGIKHTWIGKVTAWQMICRLGPATIEIEGSNISITTGDAPGDCWRGTMEGWPRRSGRNFCVEICSDKLLDPVRIWETGKWLRNLRFRSSRGTEHLLSLEGAPRIPLFPNDFKWDGNLWDAAALLFVMAVPYRSVLTSSRAE